MATLKELNNMGNDLEGMLFLRTSPIAVKFIEKEEDIPKDAYRPKRDEGVHLAQCQAFAMSRRDGTTVAMLKEDNWCWAPLIAFGLVEKPEFFCKGDILAPHMVKDPEAAKKLVDNFPTLESGKYIGIVSAPLKNTGFKPDLVLIYSNTAQLRSMLLAIKYTEGQLVKSEFDPIDSCIFSTIPTFLNNEYRITIPDPGDYERAMATEDEIILSVPGSKLEDLVSGLKHFKERGLGYKGLKMIMRPDFPRPPFYTQLFKEWGLDHES
jgi:uncharacterized protein (DUF169 family)